MEKFELQVAYEETCIRGISDNSNFSTLSASNPLYKPRKRGRNGRTTTKEQKKLDTNMFESCMEDLWSKIPDDKKSSCTYLDSLWFSLYEKGLEKSKVSMWIRRKQIFSNKYVFVPILCWRHWSLLILCHFGESIHSDTKRPCMLLLDSLQEINAQRLEPDIRSFVLDVYKMEGRGDKEEAISDIPLLVPKVPQQRDGEACGFFVLYFIQQFLNNAPEIFTQEDYPYFLTEDWFDLEDLQSFRKEMESCFMRKVKDLEPYVHQTPIGKNEQPTKAKHADLEGNASVGDAFNVHCANEQLNIKEGGDPSMESVTGVDTSKEEEQVQKMSKMIVSFTRSEKAQKIDNQPSVASTEELNEALQMPFGSCSPKNSLNGIKTAVIGNLSHDALNVGRCQKLTKKAGGETLGECHSMAQLDADTRGSTSDKDQTVKESSKMNVSSSTKSHAISKFDIQLNETAREEQDETLQMPLCGQVPNNTVIEKKTTFTDLMEPLMIHLPFLKTSPIWEQIETMEAFHVMPQQPHYCPLEQYHEELREGMAIGLMVTFANLVVSIHKSGIHDTDAVFEGRLKTLIHLEGHGFNFKHIRACLQELRRIKVNQGLAEEKRVALEENISVLQCEGHELDKKLIELEEERALIMAQKESNDSEIAKLQVDVQASKQACQSAEHEFDAVLAADWKLH